MARSAEKWNSIRDVFYWIGVVLAIAAFCVVGASNTEIGSHLEHQTIPLSWILAGAAILALLVSERCNSAAAAPSWPEPLAAKGPADPAESKASTAPEIATHAFREHA
jgi:hypothetical protein